MGYFSFQYGPISNSGIALRYGAEVRKIPTDHLNSMALRSKPPKLIPKYLSLVPEVQEFTVLTLSGPETSSDVFFKHPRVPNQLYKLN